MLRYTIAFCIYFENASSHQDINKNARDLTCSDVTYIEECLPLSTKSECLPICTFGHVTVTFHGEPVYSYIPTRRRLYLGPFGQMDEALKVDDHHVRDICMHSRVSRAKNIKLCNDSHIIV